jgi:hypothetical protein
MPSYRIYSSHPDKEHAEKVHSQRHSALYLLKSLFSVSERRAK